MRCFFGLILICCLASCGHKKADVNLGAFPADSLISRDQMIRVMVDLHLVEAALQLERNRGGKLPELTREYFSWLYSRYHVSRKRFQANIDYYKRNPEEFSKMYEEVVKELTNRWKKEAGVKN
ncbi:MAG: DUF4296 domain-containing protein [Bacteroidetes bacterium]|nr:DUF4296 domain-containing protein [Bacteroidota bacterium]